MVKRIRAAVDARRDPNFLIWRAPTPRAIEGLDAAIDRAKALVDAGADAIFPEAMRRRSASSRRCRAAVDVPMLANMTEFGKSELLDRGAAGRPRRATSSSTRSRMLRLAMGAVEAGPARDRRATGTQAGLLDQMQHRAGSTTCSTTRSTTTSTPTSSTSRLSASSDRHDRTDRHDEHRRSRRASPASSSTTPRSRRSTRRPTRCSTAATRCRSSRRTQLRGGRLPALVRRAADGGASWPRSAPQERAAARARPSTVAQ